MHRPERRRRQMRWTARGRHGARAARRAEVKPQPRPGGVSAASARSSAQVALPVTTTVNPAGLVRKHRPLPPGGGLVEAPGPPVHEGRRDRRPVVGHPPDERADARVGLLAARPACSSLGRPFIQVPPPGRAACGPSGLIAPAAPRSAVRRRGPRARLAGSWPCGCGPRSRTWPALGLPIRRRRRPSLVRD